MRSYQTLSASAFLLLSFRVLEALSIPQQDCDTYIVPFFDGGFTQHTIIGFTGPDTVPPADSESDVLPFNQTVAALAARGLSISNYSINTSPIPVTFVPENVYISQGMLTLKNSAYSGNGSIQGAEVVTDEAFDFVSLRVRIFSGATPGTVEGSFYQLNDGRQLEIGWTLVTKTRDVPPDIFATWEALAPGIPIVSFTMSPPLDPVTSAPLDPAHNWIEYRIDASPNVTAFYLNRELRQVSQLNIPIVPARVGRLRFNIWSNGDPQWVNGPPTRDSVTWIAYIEVYKGYTPNRYGLVCTAV